MTALKHAVGTRLTADDLAYLDRCVAADATALASHGIKVSRSTVLASCLRARQIREAGLDSPEKIAAFNSVSPLYKCVGRDCPGLPYRASDRPHPVGCGMGDDPPKAKRNSKETA